MDYTTHTGFLRKRTGLSRLWKLGRQTSQRYFVLDGKKQKLQIFKSDDRLDLRQEFPFDSIVKVTDVYMHDLGSNQTNNSPWQHQFKVELKERDLWLYAPSELHKQRWIGAFQKVLSKDELEDSRIEDSMNFSRDISRSIALGEIGEQRLLLGKEQRRYSVIFPDVNSAK